MFGHTSDPQQNNDNQPAADAPMDDQTTTAPQIDDTAGEFLDDVTPATLPQTVTQPDGGDATTLPTPSDPMSSNDVPAATPSTPTPASTPNADALLDIKQQALQQLTPLIGHLEQTAEEKFRTTMMMIQAADNHELISTAYEAAQQITDEKARAQALLDIVNEINYFTHNNSAAA